MEEFLPTFLFANFMSSSWKEKGGRENAFMQRLADDGFLKRRLIIGKSSLARNIAFSSTLFAPPLPHTTPFSKRFLPAKTTLRKVKRWHRCSTNYSTGAYAFEVPKDLGMHYQRERTNIFARSRRVEVGRGWGQNTHCI